jgi:hypothetical protein
MHTLASSPKTVAWDILFEEFGFKGLRNQQIVTTVGRHGMIEFESDIKTPLFIFNLYS